MQGLLVGILLLTATAAREPSFQTEFDRDSRLADPIKVVMSGPRAVKNYQQLLGEMGRQTGVQLVCQGAWLLEPVSIQVNGRRAHDVMVDLQLVSGGQWIKRKGASSQPAYLLIKDKQLISLFRGGGNPNTPGEALL